MTTEAVKRKERKEDIPYEYDQCSGCITDNWFWADNERGFCGGFIKNPSPKEDVLRFCFLDKEGSTFIDVTLDEAFDVVATLATTACEYIKKRRRKEEKT